MASLDTTSSFVIASPLDEAAQPPVIGERLESRQRQSNKKLQPCQSQNQGLRRDSDDAVDGKAQLSEADWQHRIEKRRRAIADLKATESYLSFSHGPNRPTTPDPADRTLNKRRWDTSVALWKQALRGVDPSTPIVAPPPMAIPATRLTAASRSVSGSKAGALDYSARPSVESARRVSDTCRREVSKPAKKPVLGNLMRSLLFVVVACAGLTCDQLLFGDMDAPQPTACEIQQAEKASGSLKWEEFASTNQKVGSAQASMPMLQADAVAEPGINHVVPLAAR